MSRYTRSGCVILQNGLWMAQAVGEFEAEQILDALQDAEPVPLGPSKPGETRETIHWGPRASELGDPLLMSVSDVPGVPAGQYRKRPVSYESASKAVQPKHVRSIQQDEYACSCGLRWDTNEDDPH